MEKHSHTHIFLLFVARHIWAAILPFEHIYMFVCTRLLIAGFLFVCEWLLRQLLHDHHFDAPFECFIDDAVLCTNDRIRHEKNAR